MNIEHKKTTLGDDSVLYQKRDDSLGKKDISNLSALGKLGYFKDYYLKIVIVVILIIAAAAYLIYSTTFGHKETAASLVFLNDSYIADLEKISTTLEEYLALEDKKEFVSVSHYDLENYQENMAYNTLVAAGSIDVIVCPKEYFEQGCAAGYFINLSEYLPEEMYEALDEKLVEGRFAVTDDFGEVLSYEEPLPFGIDISDSARLEEFDAGSSDFILGIISNTDSTENVLNIVSWFTDVAVPAASVEAAPTE